MCLRSEGHGTRQIWKWRGLALAGRDYGWHDRQVLVIRIREGDSSSNLQGRPANAPDWHAASADPAYD